MKTLHERAVEANRDIIEMFQKDRPEWRPTAEQIQLAEASLLDAFRCAADAGRFDALTARLERVEKYIDALEKGSAALLRKKAI